MELTVTAPNHSQVYNAVTNRRVTYLDMDTIVQSIAFEALQSIRGSLSSHIRTGLTIESTQIRKLAQSNNMVAYGVGSWTRGWQLRWLDRGRKEVYPVNRKYLRFQLWPSHQWVFARRAAATTGLNLMSTAIQRASTSAPKIVERVLRK